MTKEIRKHLTANAEFSKKQIMTNNFLGGLAWGTGTVIGATIVVAIIFSVLRQFDIPAMNELLNQAQIHANP